MVHRFRRHVGPAAFAALGLSVALVAACGADDSPGQPPPPPLPDAGPEASPPPVPPPPPPPPPLQCKPGTADCDQERSDGCEVDLDHDAKNCGACGVSCGTAACVSGTCAPEVIASGLVPPAAFAVTSSAAYLSTYFEQPTGPGLTSIVRVALDDGSTKPLIASTTGSISELTVAGDRLYAYVVGGAAILGAPLDGAPAAVDSFPLPTFNDSPLVIVGDTAYTYAHPIVVSSSDTPSGAILARPLRAGAAAVTFASGVGELAGMAARPDALYAAVKPTGSIVRFPLDGAPGTTVVSGVSDLQAVAVDDQRVYWLTQPATGDGVVESAPLAGGARTVLVAHAGHPLALAQNATTLFYVADDPPADDAGAPVRHLVAVRKTGGPPRVLATLSQQPYTTPLFVADDAHVLFLDVDATPTTYTTKLLRVPAVDGGSGPTPPREVAACDATHADCNHDPSDGCEASLDGDAANCGACGHACLGGICAKSACGATQTGVYVGLDEYDGAGVLANDGTDVYWSSRVNGSSTSVHLFRRSVLGGAVTDVAPLPNGGDPYAVDAERVFVLQGGTTIVSVPKAGGAETFLATANDKQHLYPKVVVRGGFVYWMTDSQVWRTSTTAAAPPTSVVTVGGIEDFDVDDASVYAAAWSGPSGPGVYVAPNDGSRAPAMLVPGGSWQDTAGRPTAVHVDANGIYIGTYGGTIESAAKSGGSPTTLGNVGSLYPWYAMTTTDSGIFVATRTSYQRFAKNGAAPTPDTSSYGGAYVVTPEAIAFTSYGLGVLAR